MFLNDSERKLIAKLGEKAPEWFANMVADAMIKFGPDGHCDGAEVIAAIAWRAAQDGREPDWREDR
jgi:hypothetical protein